jgi:hypothetical protein
MTHTHTHTVKLEVYLFFCYHHDCVDVDALATGTTYVNENHVTLYLEYYD